MPVVLFLAATVIAAAAESRVGLEPVMTKGPAAAPVTIVEFSDYQ
jgi:hypothetical protein